MSTKEQLPLILEAVLFSAGKPLSEQQLLQLFTDEERPGLADLRQAIFTLQEFYSTRGIELVCIASGYQFQSKIDFATWISRLWEEKPSKYSRALLETLALIAYRQPITRGEIEEIRGVSISTSIFKTLLEDRGWIRVVGHRDVPGRPGLYATTKQFLDYFGLHSLDQLPTLPEILALTDINIESAPQQMQLPELTEAAEIETTTEVLESEEIAEEIAETEEFLELETTEI
jgi:segregation and condensation protein B